MRGEGGTRLEGGGRGTGWGGEGSDCVGLGVVWVRVVVGEEFFEVWVGVLVD